MFNHDFGKAVIGDDIPMIRRLIIASFAAGCVATVGLCLLFG